MTPSAPSPRPLSTGPEPGGPEPAGARSEKAALRRALLAARHASSGADAASAGTALADAVLALEQVGRGGTVACYVSVGTEPPTEALVQRLRGAGTTVLAPVLLADGDLDWARWTGDEVAGPRGLREPAGPRLGPGAVAGAALVVVPALAVGRDGTRLGRGGGSYDRALARLPATAYVLALLWDGELLDAVPAQAHDVPVHAAATPSGLYRVRVPDAGGTR